MTYFTGAAQDTAFTVTGRYKFPPSRTRSRYWPVPFPVVRPGDVIERVNDQAVSTPADVAKALQTSNASGEDAKRAVAVMLIDRDGHERYVAVEITQS